MSKQYAPRTHATRANYPNKQDGPGQLEVISRSHEKKCHRPTEKPLLSFPFLRPKWSHTHFVIWLHGVSYESLSNGPRFQPFFRPLPVSLLFQLHCRGGRFVRVTRRSAEKICLEAEASSESRFSFLVKSHYSSDSALIALLNLNHFLVSWDLIKKTITALGIKVLRWSGHTCDRCEDEHL